MSSPEGSLKRMQVSVKTGSFSSFSSSCLLRLSNCGPSLKRWVMERYFEDLFLLLGGQDALAFAVVVLDGAFPAYVGVCGLLQGFGFEEGGASGDGRFDERLGHRRVPLWPF